MTFLAINTKMKAPKRKRTFAITLLFLAILLSALILVVYFSNPNIFIGVDERLLIQPFETVPPACNVTFPKNDIETNLIIVIQDTGGGLDSIKLIKSVNSDVNISKFSLGSNDPISITAVKEIQSRDSTITLEARDISGNSNICGPFNY